MRFMLLLPSRIANPSELHHAAYLLIILNRVNCIRWQIKRSLRCEVHFGVGSERLARATFWCYLSGLIEEACSSYVTH